MAEKHLQDRNCHKAACIMCQHDQLAAPPEAAECGVKLRNQCYQPVFEPRSWRANPPQTLADEMRPRCCRTRRRWVSWSQARWTAQEVDVAAARRSMAEEHLRVLARRDAEIADATANGRVAAVAAAKALNEAAAKIADREADIRRLKAAAAKQAAALAAAQAEAGAASVNAEQKGKALAAAEGSRAQIAGALRALTGQHERTCAIGSRAAEELEQLTAAYDQLSEQVCSVC